MIVGTEDVPTGDDLILSASFEKEGQDADGAHRDAVALPRRHEGRRGARSRPSSARSPSQAQVSTSAGTAASRSPTTTPASRRTRSPAARINRVAVDVSGEPYLDLERERRRCCCEAQ